MLDAHGAAYQFLLHGCAGRGEQVGTKSISSCPHFCPLLLGNPPYSPPRGSHSDELVLQLWLGDDVHLDGVKQLTGDEVLRDLWKGVTRSPLGNLITRQSTQGDLQDLSSLLQGFPFLPSTQAYFTFVFPHTHYVFTYLLAFAYAVPSSWHTPPTPKFLCIQGY